MKWNIVFRTARKIKGLYTKGKQIKNKQKTLLLKKQIHREHTIKRETTRGHRRVDIGNGYFMRVHEMKGKCRQSQENTLEHRVKENYWEHNRRRGKKT